MYFVIKLLPIRRTFPKDVTAEEMTIMQQHKAYWKDYMDQGIMLIYCPVLDPVGIDGLGIVRVESKEQLKPLLANDPAVKISQYIYHHMMAVVSYALSLKRLTKKNFVQRHLSISTLLHLAPIVK